MLTNDTAKDLRSLIADFSILSTSLQLDMSKLAGNETAGLSLSQCEVLNEQITSCREHLLSVTEGPDSLNRSLVVAIHLLSDLFTEWVMIIEER